MLNTDIKILETRRKLYRDLHIAYKKQGLKSENSVEIPSSLSVNRKDSFEHIRRISEGEKSKDVPIGEIHRIPFLIKNGIKYNLSNFRWKYLPSDTYKVIKNIGVNIFDSRARDIDICLAKYSKKVAESFDVTSACYTGTKHALWSSGVLNDYSDMPRGRARDALKYLEAHPEKFEKLDISLAELKKAPPGYIVVYTKPGKDGHMAVTNGYGQEMADCTDNMKWIEWQNADEGAQFHAYRLTDKWKYNPLKLKLEFQG